MLVRGGQYGPSHERRTSKMPESYNNIPIWVQDPKCYGTIQMEVSVVNPMGLKIENL